MPLQQSVGRRRPPAAERQGVRQSRPSWVPGGHWDGSERTLDLLHAGRRNMGARHHAV